MVPPILYVAIKEKFNLMKMYKIFKACRTINRYNLFDEQFYLSNYPFLKNANMPLLCHYIYHGYKEEKEPSENFNAKYYLQTHPDLMKNGLNPLLHYVNHGGKERFPSHEISELKNSDTNKKLINAYNKIIEQQEILDYYSEKLNLCEKDLKNQKKKFERYKKETN